jgi:hypothetical protein
MYLHFYYEIIWLLPDSNAFVPIRPAIVTGVFERLKIRKTIQVQAAFNELIRMDFLSEKLHKKPNCCVAHSANLE